MGVCLKMRDSEWKKRLKRHDEKKFRQGSSMAGAQEESNVVKGDVKILEALDVKLFCYRSIDTIFWSLGVS